MSDRPDSLSGLGFKNIIATSNTTTPSQISLPTCWKTNTQYGKSTTLWKYYTSLKKGRAMDTIERNHIYKETKNGTQINDKNTVKNNRIYETIIQGKANRMRLRNRPNTGQT